MTQKLTIDDYPGARIYLSAKCPACKQFIDDLPDYLPTVEDKASAPITCPHCGETDIEVRCLATVDCYVARKGQPWFTMGVGKRGKINRP